LNLIEKIASTLSLVGVPMGRLDPCNLIVDASRSFIQADELAKHGINIPGRVMSTAEFKVAAQEYVGLDLVSEVLDEEVYNGVNILEHSKLLARRLIESKEDHPEYFEKSLSQIAGDIASAQEKLLR
jgi:hypothetical protein